MIRFPGLSGALLALSLSLAAAEAQIPSYTGDLILGAFDSPDPEVGVTSNLLRGREILVDLSMLATVTEGETLRIELFAGTIYYARFETKTYLLGSSRKVTWRGSLVGHPGSTFTLTRVEEAVAATFTPQLLMRSQFRIQTKGLQTFAREYGPSMEPVREESVSPRLARSSSSFGTQATTGTQGGPPMLGAGTSCDDDPNNITILIAYTHEARIAAGGTTAIEAELLQALADANTAFQAAGVTLHATRVAEVQLGTNSNHLPSTLLRWFRLPNDGVADEVPVWRAQDGADLVFIAVNEAAATRSFYQPMQATDYEDPDTGWSLARFDSVPAPQSGLAKTIGASFGCGNEPAQNAGTLIAPYAQAHTWSYFGGVTTGIDEHYRTLRAIAWPSSCGNFTCQYIVIPAFSSPSRRVNGWRIGTATSDNQRVIEEWKQQVANWSLRIAGNYDTPSITSQPQPATVCAGYYASPVTVMSVTADYTTSYQWFKDGVAVLGQDTDRLRFTGVIDASMGGNYYCEVRSCDPTSAGLATTNTVTLTIDTNCRPSRIDNPSATALTSVAPSDFNLTELGDVNGDGYQDFVFGHPKASSSSRLEGGALYVYSGATLDPMYAQTGSVTFGHLGQSFASTDLNDDGYDELIVGIPGDNKIAIHRGRATGLTSWYSLTGPATGYGQHLSSARLPDSGGQGFFASDLANHLFMVSGFGGPDWTVDVGYEIRGLCTVGDVDGDGRDDVALGLFQATNSLQVRSGRDGSLIWSRSGLNLAVPAFAAIGDIDGDLIPDLAVAPSGANTHLVSGANGTTLRQLSVTTAHLSGSGGDLDGDGLEDLIVGLTSSYNRANVYSTSTGALLESVLNCNGETILGTDLDGDSRGEKVYHVQGSDHFAIADSPSVGTGPGLFKPYGTRCSDSASRLATVDVPDVVLPRIDRTTNLQLYGLPQNTQAYVSVGFSRLVFDLSGLGIPCNMYTEFNPIMSAATGSGRTALAIPIPNDVNLIGGRLMLQAFVPDLASTNALPFTLSNGGELTIGASF